MADSKRLYGFLQEPVEDPILEAAFLPIWDRRDFLAADPDRLVVTEKAESQVSVETLRQVYPDPCEDTTLLWHVPNPTSRDLRLFVKPPRLLGGLIWLLRFPVLKRHLFYDVAKALEACKRHGKVLSGAHWRFEEETGILEQGCYVVAQKESEAAPDYWSWWIYDPAEAEKRLKQHVRRQERRKPPAPSVAVWYDALRDLRWALEGHLQGSLPYFPFYFNSGSSLPKLVQVLPGLLQLVFLLGLEKDVFRSEGVRKFFDEVWPGLRPFYMSRMRQSKVPAMEAWGLWQGLVELEKQRPKQVPETPRDMPERLRKRWLLGRLSEEKAGRIPHWQIGRLWLWWQEGSVAKISLSLQDGRTWNLTTTGDSKVVLEVVEEGFRIPDVRELIAWDQVAKWEVGSTRSEVLLWPNQ